MGPPFLHWPSLGGAKGLGQALQALGAPCPDHPLQPQLCICTAAARLTEMAHQEADAPELSARPRHGQARVHWGQRRRSLPSPRWPALASVWGSALAGVWPCQLATLLCHLPVPLSRPLNHTGFLGIPQYLPAPCLRSLPRHLCKAGFLVCGSQEGREARERERARGRAVAARVTGARVRI